MKRSVKIMVSIGAAGMTLFCFFALVFANGDSLVISNSEFVGRGDYASSHYRVTVMNASGTVATIIRVKTCCGLSVAGCPGILQPREKGVIDLVLDARSDATDAEFNGTVFADVDGLVALKFSVNSPQAGDVISGHRSATGPNDYGSSVLESE